MRGPSLQKATILSFALHLTVFFVAVLMLRHSNRMIMPVPYTVSLVSPEVFKGIDKGPVTDTATDTDAGKSDTVLKESREAAVKAAEPQKSKKETAKEKEMVDRKISALAAKKKIEKLVRLRSIISLKAGAENRTAQVRSAASATPSGAGHQPEDYYTTITKEIWQQWVYPDVGRKDIGAVIFIKILRDGTALVQRIEKSSGNTLFDRSALKALAKASPLTPPPYEMEIGVRFYP
jgi:colicin import membrane protein